MNTINNITRFSLIPRMLTVALFVIFTFSAHGQELIREAPSEAHGMSIIRHGRMDSTWIYEYAFGEIDRSSFVLATGGSTYANAIFFDSLFVNDFEIFEGKVYLCGYMLDETMNRVAMFGYFLINQFPNCNINYCLVDDCTEFKKIDVYKTVQMQFMEETHLVMTGTSRAGHTDVLVDITKSITPPIYGNIYESNNENESIDDVAVTDKYVVVSTRNKENGIPLIYYWQFDRPQLLGQDIFSVSMKRIRVSSPISESPVSLEHTEDDNDAAVYKNSGYQQIEMTLLEAPYTIHGGFTIFGDQFNECTIPTDIKYSKNTNVYDILAHKETHLVDYVIFPEMRIYHVTSDELGNISLLGNGTRYPYNEIFSIDHVGGGYFVASGRGFESTALRMFEYKYNKWDECPEKFNYPYRLGKPEWGYVGEYVLPAFDMYLEINKKETEKKIIQFPVICEKE